MGYAVGSEFPHYDSGYPDLAELLHLYRKLTDEYTELLKQITDTNTKLDTYMNEIESKIPGWMEQASSAQKAEIQLIITDIKNEMAQFSNQLNAAMQENQRVINQQLKNQDAKVCARLKENVQWVTCTVQQMKTWVKCQNEQLDNLISTKFEALMGQFNTLNAGVQAFREELNALENVVNANNENLIKALNNYNTLMRLWYWERRWEDKKWLEEEMQKLRDYIQGFPQDDIPVRDYVTGDIQTMAQAFEDYWKYVAGRDGYSAGEWDRRSWLTAEVFDESGCTAVGFYTNAKHILHDGWEREMMFSPVTGKYVWVGTAIQQVFNALNPNGTTAEEYDALNMTAETYDGKDITAANYIARKMEGD